MNRVETALRKEVRRVLVAQGYRIKKGQFYLDTDDREEKRHLHQLSRAERIRESIDFIESFLPEASKHILDSSSLEVSKIKPRLIEVQSGTREGNLFRWWNLTWWSLPYEKSYGRQMRFVVWDDYHESPIGLIGLQSPILSWSVRDKHLSIEPERRDYWVNQSLSAQRLGSLPPYNKFLGGKLVASLMTSDLVRKSFKNKYSKSKTLLLKRQLPANLLFITTTGAYGKSSVYNRLKLYDEKICDFIGYTSGSGSFHIPNTLYEGFISYLRECGYKAGRAFGNGPSVKMKNINKAMNLLGFKNGCEHGMKRAIYLFPFASNLKDVIEKEKRPTWYGRSVDDLTGYWKERWACKRVWEYEKNFFSKQNYLDELSEDLENCQNLVG
ncbi:MAG: DUF4338 domain-containing protein [Candidatus Mycalebacterium zealandia]|nr:MAG: DUF4338 domain-containing protein [Candidatus Mycalebacterium zealandia]